MLSDLRLALRTLRKSPIFTGVTVASLAIGIGAGTAIFSFLNAIRLRTLPVRAPAELRLFQWAGRNAKLGGYTGGKERKAHDGRNVGGSFPYPAFEAFRDRSTAFTSVFALFPMPRMTVRAHGDAATMGGMMVSGNFFEGYGASTLIGRPIAPQDEQPGASAVVVLTYRMWEKEFGCDPQVLGQALSVNQKAFTVIGVLPRDFAGPLLGDWAEFYLPFSSQPALVPSRPLVSSDQWWVRVMARVAPGADEDQAGANLTVLFREVLAGSSSTMDEPGILVEPGGRGLDPVLRDRMALMMLALLAIVGALLAVACANVAGLSLARGAARGQEFAVRLAIGASRFRLVRQSFVESLVLGLLAAGAGLILAHWGKALLLGSLGGVAESFHFDLRTDATVLAFAVGVAMVTALVFGLLPALRASNAAPVSGLAARGLASAPRLRLGRSLVVLQVGLSVPLVAFGGLMVRTFEVLVSERPGFDPENVLLFRVDPGQAGYRDDRLVDFLAEAKRSLAALPGVSSVGISSVALTSDSSEANDIVPNKASSVASAPVSTLVASEGYLATMGIPLLLGRDLEASDTSKSPPAAVVNETFARTFYPGVSPLGQTFRLEDGRGRSFTIVGLARDAKYTSIRDAVPPLAVFSFRQVERGAMVFAVRSVLPPLSLAPAARRTIAALDSNLALSAVRTQKQLVRESVAVDRMVAGLCGALATLALFLSSIGLYGLLAYNVTRRTNEIGLRAALGATRRDLAVSILRDALLLASLGLAAGLPVALAIAHLARSRLYGIEAFDPLTFAGTVVVLLCVACLAAFIPARKAARIDPMVALRTE